MFPSTPPSTDGYHLRNQRIATRLFIFLLMLSLYILVTYTSLISVVETITVLNPSLTKYSKLYSEHPQRLTCPCSKVSVNYGTFLQLDYVLHHVCNSDFVTSNWIEYIRKSREIAPGPVSVYDFLATGPRTFQALSAFCRLVDEIISNRLVQFYSNQFVTAN
ncbi:unnamed protein product, partial [Adineta ricciae]